MNIPEITTGGFQHQAGMNSWRKFHNNFPEITENRFEHKESFPFLYVYFLPTIGCYGLLERTVQRSAVKYRYAAIALIRTTNDGSTRDSLQTPTTDASLNIRKDGKNRLYIKKNMGFKVNLLIS